MGERSTHPEAVRAYFENFAEVQAPQNGSPLYALLCAGAVGDPEMLALAGRCPPSQPSANLLLAAVHFLLLEGASDPLRAYYPDVVAPEPARAPDAETYPLFRDFVWRHRERIEALVQSRLVQTNVVRRTTCLLPAFGLVSREAGGAPLALLEIGCSAGLNLQWDRFHHTYELPDGARVPWGDPGSPLHIATEVRGTLPPLPALEVAWRLGVDLNPIDLDDPDAVLWLRALVFPEHVERHHELEAAVSIARAHPAPVERGDIVERIEELLERAPADGALCLYASMVLNQVPREARDLLYTRIAEHSRRRPIWFVVLRGMIEGHARVELHRFREGRHDREHVSDAHAHGRWLEWLPATPSLAKPT